MRRRFVCVVSALLAVIAQGASQRPNILLIVGDDMGYADVGVHGCKDIPTPHIDSIAKNGVRCSSGYVSGPYCSPTRAALLTGRYQQRFGHEFNPGPPVAKNIDVGLSLKEKTLADRLKEAGYTTALVGKWHLGHDKKFHPLNRGFQEYFGFLGGAHSYTDAKADGNNPVMRGFDVVDEKEYLTDALSREAVGFIERNKNNPFFLYLAFNAVHAPLQAPAKYRDRFPNIAEEKRRTYAAMMSAMDDAIGRVLATLKENKLEENTLMFFISDNGGPPANASDNGKLRGYKASTWEGGIHVPFLFQWKGHLPAGKVYDQPVIQLDFLPTALVAAGVEMKEKFDGVDLLPYLSGKKKGAPHEALYWRFGQQMAIRQGDWKLVKGGRGNAVVEKPLLINLAKDVGEQNDLSDKEPKKVAQLQAAWDKWNAELIPAQWKPAPARQAKRANRANRPAAK
ncbi:MAG TPA: sulfatase [Verrucomicrobiae bacterium]|nr:sulfatase [Verrucomicrobiae bacterium]